MDLKTIILGLGAIGFGCAAVVVAAMLIHGVARLLGAV
jgi:hypothetical protein